MEDRSHSSAASGPAENPGILAFKHGRRDEEVLELVSKASGKQRRRGQLGFAAGVDRYRQNPIVANASLAIGAILFYLNYCKCPTRYDHAGECRDIPEETGI